MGLVYRTAISLVDYSVCAIIIVVGCRGWTVSYGYCCVQLDAVLLVCVLHNIVLCCVLWEFAVFLLLRVEHFVHW